MENVPGKEMISLPLFSIFKKLKAKSEALLSGIEGREIPKNNQETRKDNNRIFKDLSQNLDKMKSTFLYPQNMDFIIREVYIKALNATGFLLFMSGMVKEETIQKEVIYPLSQRCIENETEEVLAELMTKIILVESVKRVNTFETVTNSILNGNTVLFLQDTDEALSISTVGFEHRSVEKPQNENALKGPKEAFIESGKINRSLIRKQIRDEKLVTEYITVGERGINQVSLMYIQDLANPKIIEDVKKRLYQIRADCVQNIELLEQHLEERPYSLIPTVLYTERPDRAASFLLEGYMILIMDNSPASLVLPVTFWSFFHTGEDMYQRWIYGNFIRIIRALSFSIAFTTPAIYIAVTNYHQEMIPTDLVWAIAGTRETLPLPAVAEVLAMEFAFELIREAGTRIPTTIGPTIGIVGALILGQAAVQANIVSPILVIVVAITGLASFAVPEVSFNYLIRISRFTLILCGVTLGFYGISLYISATVAYMTSIKSFGVPFLSPMAPHYPSSRDMLLRPPLWKQWIRPMQAQPQDNRRKDKTGGGLG